MTQLRRRHIGWAVSSAVFLLLAAVFALSGLAESIGGIPRHYEEAQGMVVIGGASTIIRFEDTAGSAIQFEGFVNAEEGDSFTVFYDPDDPAESAVTPQGRSELVLWTFIIAAFLGAVAAALGGVAVWRFNQWRHPATPP